MEVHLAAGRAVGSTLTMGEAEIANTLRPELGARRRRPFFQPARPPVLSPGEARGYGAAGDAQPGDRSE